MSIFNTTDQKSNTKRALVLAGGGMRVSYQAGVIRALEQQGITFQIFDATSGGTINLAMILSGLDSQEVCQRWERLDVSDFVSFMPFKEYIKLSFMPAWGDTDGIIQKVFPAMGIDLRKIQNNTQAVASFNVCNYTDKINETISHNDISVEQLVGSISLPIFMPAVDYKGKLYVDAVWLRGANVKHAVQQGVEEIWLVWCIGNHETYSDGAFNQYIHMMELSTNGALNEELDWLTELNRQIESGSSPYGQQKPVKLHVIKPEITLPSEVDVYLGKVTNNTLIDMGYSDAMQYLESYNKDISRSGEQLDYSATKMRGALPGLIYNESYAGSLNPTTQAINIFQDETFDVKKIKLDLTIHIEDAEGFIAGEHQRARITGRIILDNEEATIIQGQFVFSGIPENSIEKFSLYKLNFQLREKSFILEGRKKIKHVYGHDAWSDIVNMAVKLYVEIEKDETEKQRNIVADGIVKQGVSEVTKLIASFHPLHAETTEQGNALVARYGKFLLGQYYLQFMKSDKKWWKVW